MSYIMHLHEQPTPTEKWLIREIQAAFPEPLIHHRVDHILYCKRGGEYSAVMQVHDAPDEITENRAVLSGLVFGPDHDDTTADLEDMLRSICMWAIRAGVELHILLWGDQLMYIPTFTHYGFRLSKHPRYAGWFVRKITEVEDRDRFLKDMTERGLDEPTARRLWKRQQAAFKSHMQGYTPAPEVDVQALKPMNLRALLPEKCGPSLEEQLRTGGTAVRRRARRELKREERANGRNRAAQTPSKQAVKVIYREG